MADDLIPLYALAEIALKSDTLKGSARVYAKPYLEAMLSLDSTDDFYGADSGDMIVRYALSNLQSWRGEVARNVKAELKRHLG